MIAQAGERTIAAGTARVSHVMFADPPPADAEHDLTRRQEGVTDLRARRTRVTVTHPPALEHISERVVGRWPWLDDDDEDDDDEPPELVWIGDAMFFRGGRRWLAMGRAFGGGRGRGDPTWIVEALAGARDDARELGAEDVRGTPTTRWAVTLDLDSVPARGDGLVRADVWLDADGRLRRATWIPMRPVRHKRSDPAFRIWQTVDLWDFGLAVDIAVPDVPPREHEGLASVAAALWKMRREWRRGH